MIKTYAEVLEEKEKMTNYGQDEDDRKREIEQRAVESGLKISSIKDRKITDSIILGKDEEPWTAVNIELSDDDFRRVAFQAHERDITFNKMVGLILKDGLGKAEYRFEHQSKPQLLNEDK